MAATEEPLPPGTTGLYPAGPEEVLVTRLADPVFLRRPGEASSYPLYHYRKQARVNAGSWIFCGAGGRVSVLYPDNTEVILSGLGSGVVGSESRGEPIFFLLQCDRASVTLQPGQQLRLLGGAVLSADSGPIAIERLLDEVLRVSNRSLGAARIAYRDQVFLLDPSQMIHLPLLQTGSAPSEPEEGYQTLWAAGQHLRVRGEVETVDDSRGVRLRALGEHDLAGFGLRVRLDPGDEVLFSDLAEAVGGASDALLPEQPDLPPTGEAGEEER